MPETVTDPTLMDLIDRPSPFSIYDLRDRARELWALVEKRPAYAPATIMPPLTPVVAASAPRQRPSGQAVSSRAVGTWLSSPILVGVTQRADAIVATEGRWDAACEAW